MSDTDTLIERVEQDLAWFCDKIIEPIPLHPKDREKIFKRMIQLGWLRESEYQTYLELVKKDDD